MKCGLCNKEIKADEASLMMRGKWPVHTKCMKKREQEEMDFWIAKEKEAAVK